MHPRNSRYLLIGVIVVAVAAVLIFSPQLTQEILSEVSSALGVLIPMCLLLLLFLLS